MSMYNESYNKRNRFLVGLGVTVCLLSRVTASNAQPDYVYADEPLPRPLFTIDADTPLSAMLGSATVLEQGDPEGATPVIVYTEANLGLIPADDLNALSFNRQHIVSSGQAFLLLFDVDRDTVGQATPNMTLVANNKVFNVFDQAAKNQAAGDLFLTLDGFDRAGTVITGGTKNILSNNTIACNQGDTGGVDRNLSPETSATQSSTSTTPDNSDGAASASGTGTKSRGGGWFFFCLTSGSPSAFSGADVFKDAEPEQLGNDGLYAMASDLQLQFADDIDSLVVLDLADDGFFGPGDKVLFSLTPGSPSLGIHDAATIFSYSAGAPVVEVFADSNQLGLGHPNDNVDALEVVRVLAPTPFEEATLHAIYAVWPDDCDNNGDYWPPAGCQCTNFSNCFDNPSAPTCELFDMDFNDVIDCDDWREYKLVYAHATDGSGCVPLTVEAFTAALLGSPFQLGDLCLADMNSDMQLNGLDIHSYIEAALGP